MKLHEEINQLFVGDVKLSLKEIYAALPGHTPDSIRGVIGLLTRTGLAKFTKISRGVYATKKE